MPPVGPISQPKLVRALRTLGFEGPMAGGKHPVMWRGTTRITIPNPHEGDISRGLLVRLLREAGITREEWEAV